MPWRAGDPGSSFLILLCYMSSKKYALVAWTENGKVRMVPSLVNEAADYYRQRIARLESLCEEVENEVGWLLSQSRAHEDLARFLLSVGFPREAYIEFSNAATVCTFGPDELWLQGDNCGFPALPLLYRFLAMHRECVRLAQGDRFLASSYEKSELRKDYLFFTKDDRETARELGEVWEEMKAWRLGKTS